MLSLSSQQRKKSFVRVGRQKGKINLPLYLK